MSDQERISPHYIYTISCRQVMRIKKNINYGITKNLLVRHQILQTNIMRIIWLTVRRITNEILRVKGLNKHPLSNSTPPPPCCYAFKRPITNKLTLQ